MDKYYDKVLILTLTGAYISLEDWQKRYRLDVGSPSIGKYFSYNEARFRKDVEDYGQLIVCEPLMIVMDAYRKLKGEPVVVNSFNRSPEHQEKLHADGFKAAKVSPHVFKLAVDCDTLDRADTMMNVSYVRQAGQDVHIPIRIGYEQYLNRGQSFVHIDVCPLYYGPRMIWNSAPHPPQWEVQMEW